MSRRPTWIAFVIAPLVLLVLPAGAQEVSSRAWRKPAPAPREDSAELPPAELPPAARRDSVAAESTASDADADTAPTLAAPSLHLALMPQQPFVTGGGPWMDPYATVGPCARPPQLLPAPLLPGVLPANPLLLGPTVAAPERFWLRGEYLLWWAEGMRTPPLATTSPAGTPQAQAGVLGESATSTLFGGGEINDGSFDGFRARGGFWLNPTATFGIGLEYFQLFEENDGFGASSDGTRILARPFFDVTTDQQTAQLVAFPGVVRGDIRVASATRVRSAAGHARASLLPSLAAPVPMGTFGDFASRERVDLLIGYRYLELEDELRVSDNLVSLLPAAPGTIASRDLFRTDNHFHGAELGVLHYVDWQRLWLESLIKVAVGNNNQSVQISGSSDVTEAGVTDTFTGGLLAQRTNIGTYERDDFTVVPELGVTLGFRVRPRLSLTVGYSLVYFGNVVRAGDQIDTDLNPNLFPPEAVPFTGPERPRFTFRETDFWAHGLSLGGDLRF